MNELERDEEECPLCRMLEEEGGMNLTVPYDEMLKLGLQLPPAEMLSDDDIGRKIDAIIGVLATLNVCITSTDHLSDRELYRLLCDDILRERVETYPRSERAVTTIDLIGGGSEEDIAVYLTYYADQETRERWVRDFPDDPMPEKKQKPFDRDRFLPDLHTLVGGGGH